MLVFHLEAFTRLSQDEKAKLVRLSGRNVREIRARGDLIREGDRPRGVNVILEGWACRYKQFCDGRRQIVSLFIPGDLCDSNVFILKEMDHSIGAITSLKVAEITATDFETLMLESPRITQALWWNELVAAATAREWTANVGQRSAYERIAHLLARCSSGSASSASPTATLVRGRLPRTTLPKRPASRRSTSIACSRSCGMTR